MMRGLRRFFHNLGRSFSEPTKWWLLGGLAVLWWVNRSLTAEHVGPDGKTFTYISQHSYQYGVLLMIGFNIILASSLNLVNGHTGQFSLGHAAFMAVGAYVSSVITLKIDLPLLDYSTFITVDWSHGVFAAGKQVLWLGLQSVGWLLTLGLNSAVGLLRALAAASGTLPEVIRFPFALVVGGVMAALTGFLVGVPSLRLRGDYLAIVTLGFNEIIRVLAENCTPLGAQTGLPGIPAHTNFFWTFAGVAVTIYVIHNVVNSTYGRGFLAVRDDEIAAEAMGINTTRYKVLAFVIAAFFAGIAGGLYAHFTQFINGATFDFILSVNIVVMVIIGGMGSIWGVAASAALLTIIPELLRSLSDSSVLKSTTHFFTHTLPPDRQDFILRRVQDFFKNRMIFFSLILIIVMILRPQGIFGAGAIKKKEKLKAPPPPKDKTPPTETAAAA